MITTKMYKATIWNRIKVNLHCLWHGHLIQRSFYQIEENEFGRELGCQDCLQESYRFIQNLGEAEEDQYAWVEDPLGWPAGARKKKLK